MITALGPVHLERMGSIGNIARAKAEILEDAKVGVINVDNPHLLAIATDDSLEGPLISCLTADPGADVGTVPCEAQPQRSRYMVRRSVLLRYRESFPGTWSAQLESP